MAPVAEYAESNATRESSLSDSHWLESRALSSRQDQPTFVIEVSYRAREPQWVQPVVQSMHVLMGRSAGWDSYSALPTTVVSVQAALRFLANHLDVDSPAPAVVPLEDGGLQLEWHQGGYDVEASFPVSDVHQLYVRDVETGLEHDLDPWAREVRQVVGRLRG